MVLSIAIFATVRYGSLPLEFVEELILKAMRMQPGSLFQRLILFLVRGMSMSHLLAAF